MLNSILKRIGAQRELRKHLRMLLNVASVVAEGLPSKMDGPLRGGFKLVSIANNVYSLFRSKETELSEYIDFQNMDATKNSMFAPMFFNTRLSEEFELKRFQLDGQEVVEANHPDFGRLLFIQLYESSFHHTFYNTKHFDFGKVLKRMWDLYGGRLQFEISWNKVVYSPFSNISNPLYGEDSARLEALVTRHRRYQLDNVSRTYMFHGKPGVGKTSFALAFADRIADRILRIDAQSFGSTTASDVSFIISALQPDFIMIDDLDKASIGSSLPVILSVLQEVKENIKKTSMMFTANQTEGFDAGMLRPGRIDTWLTFDPPDTNTRRNIIRGYLEAAQMDVPNELVEKLVEITDGLTQDYLREVAQRLKYESPEEVIAAIGTMRKLLEDIEEDDDDDTPKATT